jgi:hypothetical protein
LGQKILSFDILLQSAFHGLASTADKESICWKCVTSHKIYTSFFFGFCVMSHSHTSGQQNKHAPVFSFVHVFEKTLACGRPNTHHARVSPLLAITPPPARRAQQLDDRCAQ